MAAPDALYPITRHPDGWFAVARSEELAPGAVEAVSFMGHEVVLVRTGSGEARVFDAHCVHLGAHLGHGGRMEGDTLVCPFHAWRFGPDGRCVGVPYASRVPARAGLRSWPVVVTVRRCTNPFASFVAAAFPASSESRSRSRCLR